MSVYLSLRLLLNVGLVLTAMLLPYFCGFHVRPETSRPASRKPCSHNRCHRVRCRENHTESIYSEGKVGCAGSRSAALFDCTQLDLLCCRVLYEEIT